MNILEQAPILVGDGPGKMTMYGRNTHTGEYEYIRTSTHRKSMRQAAVASYHRHQMDQIKPQIKGWSETECRTARRYDELVFREA